MSKLTLWINNFLKFCKIIIQNSVTFNFSQFNFDFDDLKNCARFNHEPRGKLFWKILQRARSWKRELDGIKKLKWVSLNSTIFSLLNLVTKLFTIAHVIICGN